MLVVPRKTAFTPGYAITRGPDMFTDKNEPIEISCVFTKDKSAAEDLAYEYKAAGCNVKIGGPAYDDPGGEFTPGKYCLQGVIITHRGCVRNCPWCYVPKREGQRIRHLEVKEGNILQDNNILACNRDHKEKVWTMLRKQRAVSLRGGLDSRLLKDDDVENIRSLHLYDLWTAYDSEENKSYSLNAIRRLRSAGISQNKIRCYVMVGFNETMDEAESRLKETYIAGALPFAQLYDGYQGNDVSDWKRFTRKWSRPAIYKSFFGL